MIQGEPVTERDIASWADEAEQAEQPVFIGDLDDTSPARQLRLDFDDAGRLLEVVI